MKKYKLLSLSLSLLAVYNNYANAFDLGKDFYGKVNIKAGYSSQFYSGEIKNIIDNSLNSNPLAHSINGSIGLDVFYKATRIIHPFVGLEVGGNYNFKSDFVREHKFNRYLNVNARIGTSFRINRKFRINPYAVVGINLSKYSAPGSSNSVSTNNTTTNTANNFDSYSDSLLLKGSLGSYFTYLNNNGWMDLNKITNRIVDEYDYSEPIYNFSPYSVSNGNFGFLISDALKNDLFDTFTEENYNKLREATIHIDAGPEVENKYHFDRFFASFIDSREEYSGIFRNENTAVGIHGIVDKEHVVEKLESINLLSGYQEGDKTILKVPDILKPYISYDYDSEKAERFISALRKNGYEVIDDKAYHKIDSNFIFYKDGDPNKWYYVALQNLSPEDIQKSIEEIKQMSEYIKNEKGDWIDEEKARTIDEAIKWLKEHGYAFDKKENEDETENVENKIEMQDVKPKNIFKVGINVGFGVEGVYQFNSNVAGTLGVEYIYSQVQFDFLKVQTHTLGVKIGIQIG